MVGGAYVTLVLIPTEISVFGHDSIVWIMGWRDLVSVALAVGEGGGSVGFFLMIFLIFSLRVLIFELMS